MNDNNKNYITVGTSTKAFPEGYGKGRKSMKKQFTRPSLKPAMRVLSILVCALTVLSPSGLLAGTLPTGAVDEQTVCVLSHIARTLWPADPSEAEGLASERGWTLAADGVPLHLRRAPQQRVPAVMP